MSYAYLIAATVLLGFATPATPVLLSDADTLRSGRLTVSLPASFEENTISQEIDRVRMESSGFVDLATHRYVFAHTFQGLSWWQRVKFARGIGYAGSSDYTYNRVPMEGLPLSDSFARLSGRAYAVTSADGGDTGYLVRGCDQDTCCEVAVQGPASGNGAHEADLADLLAAVMVER